MIFRTKREIRFFARPAWLVILAGLVFSVGYIDYLLIYPKISIDIQIFICATLANTLAICNIAVHFVGFHEKLFAKIKITNDKIIWRCILKKKHTMAIQDCRFISVELEDSFNKLDYPFIYFTTSWYPKEYAHKINKLKNTDQFIKFWYTEELAEYLITHLPKEKTGGLQYYHNMHTRKKQRKKS